MLSGPIQQTGKKIMIKFIGTSLLILMGAFGSQPELIADEQVELGKVRWNRDLKKAKVLSAKTGKPLFVQFQEVPG